MSKRENDMLKDAETVLGKALEFGYMSVGVEHQHKAISDIEVLQKELEQHRKDAISRNDETLANLAWIAARFAHATHQFISMWVHFKKDEMESAWDALVSAQENLETAMRLRHASGFAELSRRLNVAEILLFPPCAFTSASLLFRSMECSICHAEYGDCEHVAGSLYMGEMCYKLPRDVMHIDHVAIVDEPEDKRLRFPAIVNGKDRCSLTLRERTQSNNTVEEPPPSE